MNEINLFKYNRHWDKLFRYSYPKQRSIFDHLKNELFSRQIIELSGLRRTGKTTLLFQLINFLLDQGVNPFSIWYFTFDEERPKLEDLINLFSKQTQIDFKKEKIYIFFDEIQKLPDFQNQIKIYYDLYPDLKFFISGSTSLFIKKKIQESLTGRLTSFFLTPLSFKEYLKFIDQLEILQKPLLFKNEINNHFEHLLQNQLIEALSFSDIKFKKEYYLNIMRKIVFEDIPNIFNISNPEILWRLIKIIAQHPGLIIDYQHTANDIGVSNKTISLYLYYLEESFLIKKLYNFSKNQITSEKKLKKYYLASPSFSWALVDFPDTNRMVENLVLSLKNYRFFWRDPYQHEIDFIELENANRVNPIEVKFKQNITKKDYKNLLIFLNKFNYHRATILTKNIENRIFSIPYNNSNLYQIHEYPVYLF